MSFVVDITLGTLLCWYLLQLLDKFLTYKKAKVGSPHQKLKSGNYFRRVEVEGGKPDVQIDYLIWFEQTALWCIIVIIVNSGNPDEGFGVDPATHLQASDRMARQFLYVPVDLPH